MSDYPKDWEEVKLGDIPIQIKKGDLITKKERANGNIPVIAGGKSPAYYCNRYNREGTTITVSASGANAGYVNLFYGQIFASDCSTIKEDCSYCIEYIYYLMANEQENIYKLQTGGAQPHVHPKDIEKLEVIYSRNIEEQKAIADTLMTFDKHIENLEKLIEKKKMIRDGAVEDLMTGKTRLNGFDGEWEEVKLEDVCNDNGMVRGPFGGSLKKEYFVNKGYKVYEQRNAIYKSVDIGNYYIDFNKFEELKRFKLKENDFIISCSGTIGEIYQIPKKFKKGIINQALLKISINTNLCDLTFFKNYFSWEKFKSKIIDDTQGGAMKNLVGMDKFRKTRLYIPTDIKEQEAIASILTSMDDEIENLEKEKTKIEKIKAGAMDDLLTGRVRLI